MGSQVQSGRQSVKVAVDWKWTANRQVFFSRNSTIIEPFIILTVHYHDRPLSWPSIFITSSIFITPSAFEQIPQWSFLYITSCNYYSGVWTDIIMVCQKCMCGLFRDVFWFVVFWRRRPRGVLQPLIQAGSNNILIFNSKVFFINPSPFIS